MKLFVLNDYENCTCLGIFDSLSEAEHLKALYLDGEPTIPQAYVVEEVELRVSGNGRIGSYMGVIEALNNQIGNVL